MPDNRSPETPGPETAETLVQVRSALAAPGARRAVWGVANQAVDSLSNFFLSIWIARLVTPAEFGAFGVVYVGVTMAIIVARSSANVPMMIHYGGSSWRFSRKVAGDVLGVSMAIGLATSAVLLAVGLATHGPIRTVALAFAAVAPALTLQDSCIYLFIARQRPQLSLVNNIVWAVLQVALFLGVSAFAGARHAWVYILLWGAAAAVAVLVSLVSLRTPPRLSSVPPWLRRFRATISNLVSEAAIGQIGQQGVTYIFAIGVSLTGIGAYRAAQVPMGVLRIFIQGLQPMGITEGSRLFRKRPHLLPRLTYGWILAGAALTVLFGAGLLALPTSVGHALLGASWEHARAILVPVTLGAVSNAVQVPVGAGFRSMKATDVSVRLRAPIVAVQLASALTGVLLGGLKGGVWAYAIGSLVATLSGLVVYRRTFARRRPDRGAAAPTMGRHEARPAGQHPSA